MAKNLRMELMEAADEKAGVPNLTFKPGLSLEGMNEISKHVEEFVAADNEGG